MNKESLNNLSRTEKIVFLKKLASRDFKLKKTFMLRPLLEFHLQENSKYQCKQDGRTLSIADIKELRYFYSFNRALVQFSIDGLLPGEIVLVPVDEGELPQTEAEYMHYMLCSAEHSCMSDSELEQRIEELERKILLKEDENHE